MLRSSLSARIAFLALASAAIAGVTAGPASANGLWPPYTHMKVVAAPTSFITTVDSELFSDEVDTFNINGSVLGKYSAHKETSKVLLERCGGGEVRAQLVVEGWTYYDWANRADVKARMNLYEGASRSTTDLDGQSDWTYFMLLAGQTHSSTIHVKNTKEGGDYATVKIKFTGGRPRPARSRDAAQPEEREPCEQRGEAGEHAGLDRLHVQRLVGR